MMRSAMATKLNFHQVALRLFATASLAAPFIVLFGLSPLERHGHEVPPAQYGRWFSEHFSIITGTWSIGVAVYALGFWTAFFLLRRRTLRPRAVGLWWWALICGLLAASFVPWGTLLAVPCLVTLFWRRSLYFNPIESAT